MIKVSDYIAAFLVQKKIREIFAISGAGNVHLFDSIANHPDLRYICPHHEQAGAMAAIGYTRLSDRCGVMMTTAGPGASNAITGALSAWADSIPILMISGQEKSVYANRKNPLRMWGVQGFDIVRAVEGITKYAAIIDTPESVRFHLEKAFYLMREGRPGPAWLDIPVDVQSALIDPSLLDGFTPTIEEKRPTVTTEQLAAVLHELGRARRPVLLLGQGIRLGGSLNEMFELVDKLRIPVLTSWNGADLLPSDHPRHFGHAGVYGQRCANFVLQNADLLLTVGTRLAIPQVGYDLSEFVRAGRRIMVDIDESELNKFAGVFDLLIRSDAGIFMSALTRTLERPIEARDWLRTCEDWRDRYPLVEHSVHTQPDVGLINSYHFIDRLSRLLAKDDVVVTDMGTALTCTHQTISLRGDQRLMTSTGLGEMGFGLPGAIGAAFACPDKRIVLIVGDGSFMMNLQELQTVVHHHLPIKIFLYENDGYLTIKHTQNALFKGRFAGSNAQTGVSCPNFQGLARVFGLQTFHLENWADATDIIQRTLDADGPTLCSIRMDPEQLLAPKINFLSRKDGSLVSPPLEDLYPFVPREVLKNEMLIGIHPKSQNTQTA